MRPISYSEEVLKYIENKSVNDVTNLNNNIIDMESFLSDNDLFYFMRIVKEVDGLGMIRILPFQYNDYKKFGSNIMKVIKTPLKELNNQTLPIHHYLEQRIKDLKFEKISKHYSKEILDQCQINLLIENKDLNHFFELKDYFCLENYNFPHLIKSLNINTFKFSTIKSDIEKMMKMLSITNTTEKGLNLLLTKDFLFITPLTNPYTIYKDIPIFAEPYFYAGVFILPKIENDWPECLKSEFIQFNLSEILKISST